MATSILWDFIVSTTSAFQIEVGNEYMRFFTNQQQVEIGGSPYEITSPYLAADLLDIQHKQINDVMYITHPSYPPYKLTRVSDASWTLSEVGFNFPATLEENATETTITASAETGTIHLEASADIFQVGHIGSRWTIGYIRSAFTKEFNISGDSTSAGYEILGDWTFRTYGVWEAEVLLERSRDAGASYQVIRRWQGRSDRNIDATGAAEVGAYYRVVVQNWVSDTGENQARYEFGNPDTKAYGVVEITAVEDARNAEALVIERLPASRYPGDADASLVTKYWREAAWSDVRGWPRAVSTHDGRLVFAGTEHQPRTIWGSVFDDYENFEFGVLDDDAWTYTIGGERLNAILWLASKTDLLIGTTGGIWRGRGDDQGNPITPSRRNFKQQTYEECENIPPLTIGNVILFVERRGRILRELVFNIGEDNYSNPPLTLLADHVTIGGVVQLAWQHDRRVLWAVTGAGALIGMTYDREQQVTGWHVHSTNGLFESVSVIPGDDDATDECWVVVKRTIGGADSRMLEIIDDTVWTTKDDGFYVDSGLSYSGTPASHFTGMTHLPNETIDVLADGVVYHGIVVDANGEFDLPTGAEPAAVVHAGLPFTSEVQPFRLDADQRAGVHATRTKRVDSLALRVSQTTGITYELNGINVPVEFGKLQPGEDPDDLPLYTGDVALDFATGSSSDPTVLVKQSEPLPFTLLAMVVGLQVSDPG